MDTANCQGGVIAIGPWRRYWLEVAVVALVIGYPWLNGYRLTPGHALRAFRYMPPTRHQLFSFNHDWGKTMVFETSGGGHITVSCPRTLVLWRCLYTTPEPAEAVGDPVRTIGWLSWRGKGEDETVLVVRSTDKRVARIEAGQAHDRQRAAISPQQPITLRWPRSLTPDELAAEAQTADGTVLYRYTDPDNRRQWRWHPAAEQE